MPITHLPPWEHLLKSITWQQLDFIHKQRILDFGSGAGVTAAHFAQDNQVTAVEPNCAMISEGQRNRGCGSQPGFTQLIGSIECLRELNSCSFDVILCHNVIEYIAKEEERIELMNEFARLIKQGGILSVLKNNRNGRVMQMVVLLNNFAHAQELLAGKNGVSEAFGEIRYYENEKLTDWCPQFTQVKTFGIRHFWDLQQNQEIQTDPEWQNKMIMMERMVEEDRDFYKIAFFNHILLQKM